MLPDLNRLNLYYHVYSRLSITEAAQALHITPSAVSQQIKKLEMEIGASLFTRLHKRLVPTPAGKRLFTLVTAMLTGLEEGMEGLTEGRKEPSGILRIGAPAAFGSIYLPHAVSTYRNRHAKVRFELELGPPSDLIPKVDSGDLDFALVDTFPMGGQYYGNFENFNITPVIEEKVVLACSKQYNEEILRKDHTYKNLADKAYISQQTHGGALSNWFRHHFGKRAQKLDIVLTVPNHQAVVSAISHHVGLGIIASHLAWEEIRSGSIVAIKTPAGQTVNRILIVQLLDKKPTLTEKSFLSHFQGIIQKSKTLGQLNLSL